MTAIRPSTCRAIIRPDRSPIHLPSIHSKAAMTTGALVVQLWCTATTRSRIRLNTLVRAVKSALHTKRPSAALDMDLVAQNMQSDQDFSSGARWNRTTDLSIISAAL